MPIDPRKTDLDIFRGLSNEDCWVDAQLPSVFLYLMQNKNLKIPDEWQPAMHMMQLEMQKYVTWWQNKVSFLKRWLKQIEY